MRLACPRLSINHRSTFPEGSGVASMSFCSPASVTALAWETSGDSLTFVTGMVEVCFSSLTSSCSSSRACPSSSWSSAWVSTEPQAPSPSGSAVRCSKGLVSGCCVCPLWYVSTTTSSSLGRFITWEVLFRARCRGPVLLLLMLHCVGERVLGVVNSQGLDDPGPVRWPLALCLLAAWVIIFLCILKGIHSSGKVVYVTATFPYFVLIVLIIRGATLEGSLQGVAFYLTPVWERLANAQVWNDAASQIFYSLGIGVGGLLSMASYNKFDNNVIRDTLIITIGNCATSFFAGFAIFSILGHMAWRKGVPVEQVADTGPGLAFVAYPEALALLPGSVFWAILFFLMLFMLGVDTLFGNMEGITTAVLDEFPQLRTNMKQKTIFLALLCFGFYLMGLLLVTDGGIYWFTLIDSFSTSFGLIIITLFMCLGISFFYGVNQFCQDIEDMIRPCPSWCTKLLLYFKACWVFCTPFLLLFILTYIFIEMYRTSLHYGSYQYPTWGKGLGVCMGVVCCLQIPIWAIVAVWKESGTMTERFQKAIRPLNSWRDNNQSNGNQEQRAEPERVEGPYTVNLTDLDFTAMAWDTSEA
ncbi:sodium-dependent proline transporter isoform X2 [Ictalurus punctatus]|uniref:Sodium-dependent proline transporter isoform X2 n=1 Tax=Ictalurus punctatus TaxID=7998 RepID=A0A2D0T108_ICTPU|nr:sodium-dependent proline transporter isoform X2 [Ictalurus punctatus]